MFNLLALLRWKKSYPLKYISSTTWRKVFLMSDNHIHKGKEKTVFDRSSCIPLIFLGVEVNIYNGKRFTNKWISKWMVGFKFGEFTWNRRLALYKAKQLRKKLKKLNKIKNKSK